MSFSRKQMLIATIILFCAIIIGGLFMIWGWVMIACVNGNYLRCRRRAIRPCSRKTEWKVTLQRNQEWAGLILSFFLSKLPLLSFRKWNSTSAGTVPKSYCSGGMHSENGIRFDRLIWSQVEMLHELYNRRDQVMDTFTWFLDFDKQVSIAFSPKTNFLITVCRSNFIRPKWMYVSSRIFFRFFSQMCSSRSTIKFA